MLYSSALKRIVITKVIRTHFWSKKFFHNFRCNIMQLYNFEHFSRFKVCILLWWIETELSFFNRSWNEDDLSPYVILKALSFKEYILLLRPLLWNIQTKGQYQNWDIIYAFITVFLFFKTNVWSNSCWCAEFLACFFTEVVCVIFKREFWI